MSTAEQALSEGRSEPTRARELWEAEHRNEVLVLVGIVVLSVALGTPLGAYALGVIGGSVLALNALGVVLVYRSDRFINFAQVAVGASAATLFSIVVRSGTLLRLLAPVCPGCDDGSVSRPAYTAMYLVTLAVALALSMALSWLVYNLVVKRFRDRAPMMLTVASLFVARTVSSLVALFDERLSTQEQREAGFQSLGVARLPFSLRLDVGGVLFSAADVLALAVAGTALIGLTLYLRVSSSGTAIRAAAENPDRARTLGIPVERVTSRVWLLAGLLSGLAGVLGVMGGVTGFSGTDTALVQVLAVALLARFTSLPLSLAAALALGVLRQAVVARFDTVVPLEAGLVVLLGVALLLQHGRSGRAANEEQALMQAAREVRPIPAELRDVAAVKKWVRSIGVVVAVFVIGSPWALSPAQTSRTSEYMIYAIVGVSLLVLTGWAGQISLGQFAFAAVGGYAAAVFGLPFPLALLAGGAAGSLVAVVVGVPALRLRGLHLAILSLAFALAVTAVGLSPEYLGRFLPASVDRPSILGMDLDDERAFYYVTLAMLAAVLATTTGLRRSRTARALIAARDNERAAQSFGINLVKARLAAFAVSGFLAGVAGALFVFHQKALDAASFPTSRGVEMFSMAVIGGLGVIWGPVLGAVYVGLPLVFSMPAIYLLLSGGIGALVLLQYLGAGGLASLAVKLRDSVLRRVAARERIVVPSLIADMKDTEDSRPALPAKERDGGGVAYVPRRYELIDQWAFNAAARRAAGLDGETASAPADAGRRR